MEKKPVVICVSGVKNSGKTTLLRNVIPILKQMGLRVAVIKHDGHDFTPDVPNTDSYMLKQAGADTVAVYSSKRYLLVCDAADTALEDMLKLMPESDLVLVEGAKRANYPRIEVFRTENSVAPVCDPSTLLGLYTDSDIRLEGVKNIPLGDYQGVAEIIFKKVRENKCQ